MVEMARAAGLIGSNEPTAIDNTEAPPQQLPRIYIAGPMRGYEYFNFPAFDQATASLTAMGCEVVSPADLDRESGFDPHRDCAVGYDWNDIDSVGFDLHEAIDRDIAAIKSCDAIYMLRGWHQSKGAKAEHALAIWMGKKILYQEDVLEEALNITKGDRNIQYGDPNVDFTRTAKLWSVWKGVHFDPEEVAVFQILLKTSRQKHQNKRDNWVDLAGYSRCGYLCTEEGQNQI